MLFVKLDASYLLESFQNALLGLPLLEEVGSPLQITKYSGKKLSSFPLVLTQNIPQRLVKGSGVKVINLLNYAVGHLHKLL
jgi:hypothetical protein